jgi:hypothetical protein
MEPLSSEHRTRLRYLLSSLEKRELQTQAQYGVKAVLQQLASFSQAGAVLKELLGGETIPVARRCAAGCR